eukprot:1149926-Pelagomonas_calceolata.AAC.3
MCVCCWQDALLGWVTLEKSVMCDVCCWQDALLGWVTLEKSVMCDVCCFQQLLQASSCVCRALMALVVLSALLAALTCHMHSYTLQPLTSSCCVQVQLKALLLERAISCVSNTYMYTRLGFSFPLGRALALSLCSLLIGLALDVRNRCIFLKINALSATGVHSFQGKVAQVQQASDTKVQGLCNN